MKKILFITMQIFILSFYFLVGKYDWDYGMDLPFRLLFLAFFLFVTGIIFGFVFYLLGEKAEYEDDKILKIPLFFISLSVISLFWIDIIGVGKLCFYNLIFMYSVFKQKMKMKDKWYKISKIVFGLITIYFFIPIFSLTIGLITNFFENRVNFILCMIYILYIFFGFIIKNYCSEPEIKYFKIILFVNYLIIIFMFKVSGFNWYKEDYQGIILTFPYKVINYLNIISIEKEGITKSLKSKEFLYITISYISLYLGIFLREFGKKKNIKSNEIKL